MLLSSVLLTCVAFVYTFNINHPKLIELKQKERELELLKETNICDKNVKQLEKEINYLTYEVQKNLDREQCRRTYRCGSADYVPGCSCWTYVKEQENGTTIYNFNKFHWVGVETLAVGEDDELLRACDNGTYKWRYESYKDEFSHCVRDGRLECFCSLHSLETQTENNHCSNEALKPYNRCWDYLYKDTELDKYNMELIKYSFYPGDRFKACINEGNSVEEQETIKRMRTVCDFKGFVFKQTIYSEEIGFMSDFKSCIKKGDIICVCEYYRIASNFAVPSCSSDTSAVGNKCLRTVPT